VRSFHLGYHLEANAKIISRVRQKHSDLLKQDEVIVEQATIRGSLVAVSTHQPELEFQIHLLRVDDEKSSVAKTCAVDGEVTCLGLCSIGRQPCIIAGVWRRGQSYLAVYIANDPETSPAALVQLDQSKAYQGMPIPVLDC
jgi:hypothetical protein